MLRISVLGYLFAVLCGLLVLVSPSSRVGVDAACATARVRKSYDRLTYDERLLYRRALQLAMDKGYYIKFVEMHMEMMSEMEAHRVCMFTYWHRYFLLGFENMLRGLGSEFECITIPYWDEMQNNARTMTGACTNLENCSLIVRDMGGSSIGEVKGITINGAWVSGDRCVRSAPLNHFCEASSKSGTVCARCLPRTNLQLKSFPASTNFASIYRQLFTSGAFIATGKSIEDGMHNAMHNEIGGAMGTFQSPGDPLFWSHHAYVDLLLTIYLKCRVGLGKLTDEQKKNNAFAFVQCPHREDPGFFTSTSTVTMRNGELGNILKAVTDPSQVLYPFFQGLPNKYYQLSDVTTLGVNKYSFQVGGLVGQMASQCDAATGAARRLTEESVNASSRRALRRRNRRLGCKSDLADADESGQAPVDIPVDLTVDYSYDNDPDAVKVTSWVDDARAQLQTVGGDLDEKKTIEQLEKMVCMFYDQCRGGVQDYSEEFKNAFKVSEPPPCKRIVDDLKSNSTSECEKIKLPDWKQTMEKYFPCKAPSSQPAYGDANASENDLPSQ